MSRLNEDVLEKYQSYGKMHPVEWVSRMNPLDVVVLKHIIKNNFLGGKSNLHGERLVFPIKKHSHIKHVYRHLNKSKEHLMEAMLHRGGGNFLTSALDTVVSGVKKGAKAAWKAGKTAIKYGKKGFAFYTRHKDTIDKVVNYGATAADLVAEGGAAAGLWDPETAARLGKLTKRAKSLTSQDKEKQEGKGKKGKGALHGYMHG